MISLLVALILAAPVPKDNKADEEFREKVRDGREKAVKFLKEKQDKQGSWDGQNLGGFAGMKGGETSLAALSLLEAGVPANDKAITTAVDYLLAVKPERTYVVSLSTQVLAPVDAKKHAQVIQANADWLLKHAIVKADKLQGWSYPNNQIADNSNTHFAVMGLHAATKAGAKVDADIWAKLRDCLCDTQQKDGGWVYFSGDRQVTRTMTAAGLLGLAVAVKYDKKAKGPYPEFEKGMAALLGGKMVEGKSVAYELFTIAELGRATGADEFKVGKLAKAWYREGAEKVLKSQQEDGSFKFAEKGNSIDAHQPVVATACGLYLLGTGPAKK